VTGNNELGIRRPLKGSTEGRALAPALSVVEGTGSGVSPDSIFLGRGGEWNHLAFSNLLGIEMGKMEPELKFDERD
jgi:hypothetical protein